MELVISKGIEMGIPLSNSKEKDALDRIVGNVVNKGAEYILKALPIQENVKDVLIDVNRALKSKDFQKVVSTAVSSSIREGLEILGMPKQMIKDINTLKDAAIKGGLKQFLISGIDVFTHRFIKGNLFGDIISKFVESIKNFVGGKQFVNKIDIDMNKLMAKQDTFKVLCTNWYKAYEKMNLPELNEITKEMKNKQTTACLSKELTKAAETIYNMTEFVNNKKDKLSPMQVDICKNL